MEERLKSHYESLSRAIGFTKLADAKAAPILIMLVALTGTLAARFDRIASTLSQGVWSVEEVALVSLMSLYALFLILVVAIAATVFLPRTPRSGGSLIYFEDISTMSFESFRDRAGKMTPETIECELLHQIHAVSGIASYKMRRVRWAYYLCVPSVALWVLLLGWSSF